MNKIRTYLIFALLFVSYLIWMQWQQDFAPPHPPVSKPQITAVTTPSVPSSTTANASANMAVPQPMELTKATTKSEMTSLASSGQHIILRSDVLALTLDSQGGSMIKAELLKYPVKPGSKQMVDLLNDHPKKYFTIQNGLISTPGKAPSAQATYQASSQRFILRPGKKTIQAVLRWQNPVNGLTIIKRYILTRGSYDVQVTQTIENRGKTAWIGSTYEQQIRTAPQVKSGFLEGFTNPSEHAFSGAVWYSPEDKFNKLSFTDFEKDPLKKKVKGGWLGFTELYFLAAWIPEANHLEKFSSARFGRPGQERYLVRSIGPAFTVAPGRNVTSRAHLFLGPKIPDQLEAAAPGLGLSVDYGLLTIIAKPLQGLLGWLEQLTHNWGLAIILLVILIKVTFYKLSEVQYRSAAKMRKLSPRIQALNKRYADDKTKKQQAMMELYKKEKANPMAGCLPMLVPIPVFFALYYVLFSSVELRQAPFYFWIHSLSAPDPYFILPVINAAIMLAQQFLMPSTGMDPNQARIMKFMPVGMAVLFAFFPAGLVLYWVTNGLLGVLQQWYVTRKIMAEPSKH